MEVPDERVVKMAVSKRLLVGLVLVVVAGGVVSTLILSRGSSFKDTAKAKVAEANRLWDAGDIDKAVSSYQKVIDDYSYTIEPLESQQAYSRVIDYRIKIGGVNSARKYVYKAIQDDVLLDLKSPGSAQLVEEERERVAADKKKGEENWVKYGEELEKRQAENAAPEEVKGGKVEATKEGKSASPDSNEENRRRITERNSKFDLDMLTSKYGQPADIFKALKAGNMQLVSWRIGSITSDSWLVIGVLYRLDRPSEYSIIMTPRGMSQAELNATKRKLTEAAR